MTIEMSKEPCLDDICVEWLGWFDEAMPDSTPANFNTKYEEESYEFLAENDRTKKLEEMVDAFATSLAWMDREGFTMTDFRAMMLAKLHKNQGRTWARKEDGTYHHV